MKKTTINMMVLIVLALTLMGAKVSTAAGHVCTTDEAEIIFLLDWASRLSIPYQHHFAANVSAAFKVGPDNTRFGAVVFKFRNDTRKVFDLDTYSNNHDIYQELWSAPFDDDYDGPPPLDYGLILAGEMLSKARPTAAKVVIVITESESDDPYMTRSVAYNLQRDNVTILGLGVGDASQSELLTYAIQPDDVFKVDSYKDIETLKDVVIERICQVTGGNLQPQCPNGEVVRSQCLTLSSQKMTKADAMQSCAANNGGKIFEIRTEELYIQLGDIAKENGLKLWAGAKEVTEGDWKWLSDNSPANIPENWFKFGEPNNWRGNEECLQMRPNGKLNDAYCDKRFHFVCVNQRCSF